ncbi:MAG: extracellular solute-binding protein [Methylocystis sp.]
MARKSIDRSNPSRRSVLLGALAVSSALARPAHAQTTLLRVVTSFPEELTARYEQEFEKLHPGAHVQFIWKHSRDASAQLSRADQGEADVYWAPARGNFPVLRDQGAFRKYEADRAALPAKLGDQRLSDRTGMFEAFDIAGYGFAINSELLNQRGLKTPAVWRDLAEPACADQIVMPVAGKVGYAPSLYDIVLQAEGWDEGWALLSRIAGNAQLTPSGGGPAKAVKDGRAPIGLTIDFIAQSAQANGLPVAFVYPERTAFLPGHIAITATTRNYELASAFLDFALSQSGQKLMMDADNSRHPARPDAYEAKAPEAVDPFSMPDSAFFAYDAEIGRMRAGLLASLFDVAITERHSRIATLWRAIHAADRKGAGEEAHSGLNEARRLAGFSPVSARDAADPAFLRRFIDRDAIDPALTRQWRSSLDEAHDKAADILARHGTAI